MRGIDDVASVSVDVDRLVSVLSDAPITVAVLYGSHARGEATASSDIDLAIGFDESLDSTTRTRARLRLIERVSAELGTDAVDIVPLARTGSALRRSIHEEGIVIYGSPDAVPVGETAETTHDDQLVAFDELLADIERVV
jgi:predicted nucleotidyltransferase